MATQQIPEHVLNGPPDEPFAIVPVQAAPLAGPGETASTAAATMARAQVESRYLMAERHPRSMMTVRAKLLDACRRPRFAQTARYAKPIGRGKVVGFSIRFAEEVARSLGNLLVEAASTYDDATQRIVRVMATDLESNLTYPVDVTITKTVERSSPDGKQVLGQRKNSNGSTVYIVAATDDDTLVKQNALVSKAMRTAILRVLPSDILEECEEVVIATLATEDAKDPGATAKRIADHFYSLGIMPDAIERVLGHPLSLCSPAEVTLLRGWSTALKEGDTTWKEIEEAFTPETASTVGATAHTVGTAGLRERLKKDTPKGDAGNG